MSKSKPFDIVCFLFKPVWESEHQGEKYRPTGQDLKAAKEFYELNPDIFDDVVEFQERAQEYLRSRFEGWLNLKHPCWAFLKHYNSYLPKKKPVEQVKRKIMIHCTDCGKDHGAHDSCAPIRKKASDDTKNGRSPAIQNVR